MKNTAPFQQAQGLNRIIKNFNSARTFLEYLRLAKEHWASNVYSDTELKRSWVFRGQSNLKKYQVVPSAWRYEGLKILRQTAGQDILKSDFDFSSLLSGRRQSLQRWLGEHINLHRISGAIKQAYLERLAVYRFLQRADDLGIAVPKLTLSPNNPSEFASAYLESLIDLEGTSALWSEEAIALAQHHGIPTRLIDWTENPLVAAFIAAEDAVRKRFPAKTRLVIYALHSAVFRHAPLMVVRHPKANNPYLRLQQGLFLFDSDAEQLFMNTGRFPNLSSAIGRINQKTTIFQTYLPQQITLPVSEAPALLRLLSLEGWSRDKFMPTLDNVAFSLKDEWKRNSGMF